MSSPSFYCNLISWDSPDNINNDKYKSIRYSLSSLSYKYNIFHNQQSFDSINEQFLSLDMYCLLSKVLQSEYSNDIILYLLIACYHFVLHDPSSSNDYPIEFTKNVYNIICFYYESECKRISPDKPISLERIKNLESMMICNESSNKKLISCY